VSGNEIVIPERAFFKAAEVCEIAQVQAYVLRTWELEFPGLGVSRPGGGPRIYRREDVERVLAIKQLVFSEGLTLAGARRRLDGETPPPVEELSIESFVAPEVRERLTAVKRGLRDLLSMLGPAEGAAEGAAPPDAAPPQATDGELFPPEDRRERQAAPRLTIAPPARGARQAVRGPRQRKGGRR
jgi:DNA-binding transcriptional MerR regulator